MGEDIEVRRRRALYRASHRGTKELDLLIGRFAEACVPGMAESELASFERLLSLPDPLLDDLLHGREESAASDVGCLIAGLRSFHGL